ncbi:MAG: transketolase [Selenomonas ruminantium]|nr:transketolase [Selenomonas ruminantium]
MESLKERARQINIDILRMFYHSRHGHLASALSCAEIMSVLYFGCYDPKAGDRVVLSKGHGGAALYAALAEKGILEKKELATFYGYNTRLIALSTYGVPGIEISGGSLGQGICYATGLAKGLQLDGSRGYVYCVVGDGETQEGSVWEAAAFAAAQKLDNLIVIIDDNQIQCTNRTTQIVPMEPMEEKWRAFGWQTYEVDGHDTSALLETINVAKATEEKPLAIVAHTVKGHGVACIADQDECHMMIPKENEWDAVCVEFGIRREELDFK